MKNLIWAALAAMLVLVPARAQEEKKEEKQEKPAAKAEASLWIADYDKALEQAKKEKKDLFIDFTGSDWCGWCIKLHEEVFSKDEFLKEIQKKYVLVALDFPRGEEAKAKVPNEKRNTELMEKHGVQGFPTILLVASADEAVYGKSGYRPGGPVKYMEKVNALATKGPKALVEFPAMVKAYAAADEKTKPAQIEKAIAALTDAEEGIMGTDLLVNIVKDALKVDADNKAGLKLKAIKALMKLGAADAAIIADAKKLDAKNETGLYEQAVNAQFGMVNSLDAVKECVAAAEELDKLGPIKDKDVAKNICINTAFFNAQHLKDKDAAKKWAKKAKEFAGDDADLNKFLDSLIN